jgi:hypothetical protein
VLSQGEILDAEPVPSTQDIARAMELNRVGDWNRKGLPPIGLSRGQPVCGPREDAPFRKERQSVHVLKAAPDYAQPFFP